MTLTLFITHLTAFLAGAVLGAIFRGRVLKEIADLKALLLEQVTRVERKIDQLVAKAQGKL